MSSSSVYADAECVPEPDRLLRGTVCEKSAGAVGRECRPSLRAGDGICIIKALTGHNNFVNRILTGMALKDYSLLQNSFVRVGWNVKAYLASPKDFGQNASPAIFPPNPVQSAFSFNLRVFTSTTQAKPAPASSSHQVAGISTIQTHAWGWSNRSH